MRTGPYLWPVLAISCLLTCPPWDIGSASRTSLQLTPIANTAPDISGLAWLEGDTFLAVHDAKNPGENDRPRVSLVRLPKSLDGLTWKPLAVDWPKHRGPSSDLESIARIPGTDSFLLVESGEERLDQSRFRRVFLMEIRDNQAALLSFTELPEIVKNIEGSAVARIGNRLIFLCAERGDSRRSTEIFWTKLQLKPLRLGSFNKAYFRPAGFTGRNRRPASALDVDSMGRIYIASAYDPDNDSGPFSSVIWSAGRLQADGQNRIRVNLTTTPHKLATLDGLKVESLAIREARGGVIELFAGTDDENYGGVLRPIPIGH